MMRGASRPRMRWLAAPLAALIALAVAWQWHDDRHVHFLPGDTAAFVASFGAPPAVDSPETRAELDQLLALQKTRTAAEVVAARADRKTEIARFYSALGIDAAHPPALPRVERLAERVEDDVRIYVRAAKDHFRRLRPFAIEPRLNPCISNVQGDLSYPSGHAAYAWSMALLLAEMVPERRAALEARALEFANQRMVCGVHFASDLAAGRLAAEWLLRAMRQQTEYSREAAAAAQELRAALGLPPRDLGS
jgi:acid phosphatase (class A)